MVALRIVVGVGGRGRRPWRRRGRRRCAGAKIPRAGAGPPPPALTAVHDATQRDRHQSAPQSREGHELPLVPNSEHC